MIDIKHLEDDLNSYSIKELIGCGAFGKVYKAIDNITKEEVAIKIVKLSSKNPQGEKVLRQEIEILKDLEHPSIIKFKHSFEFDNQLFLVIELCKGGTLQELIEVHTKFKRSKDGSNSKIFTDEEASKIMKSILEGVSYLHSKGIVHRDLKPENILISNKDDITNLKIIDFGLTAKYNDACPLSLLDAQCGTILYMAPEVALKQEYSKSIDIWSLGIIMYNLLSGGCHPLHKKGESSETYKAKLLNKDKLFFSDNFSSLAIDLIK